MRAPGMTFCSNYERLHSAKEKGFKIIKNFIKLHNRQGVELDPAHSAKKFNIRVLCKNGTGALVTQIK